MPELPIACTLTPEALRTRREGLLTELVRRSARREDLADGLRFEFVPSAETIALIARAVEAERHCCRFLRFGMTVEPDGGPVFLDLTGPAGTRDFVSALIEGDCQRRHLRDRGVFRGRRLLRILDVASPRGHTPHRCAWSGEPHCLRLRPDACGLGVAGRAYAAYGGIYIAASLVWLWLIEGQAPTRTDLIGAALAISGALIIIGFAVRAR